MHKLQNCFRSLLLAWPGLDSAKTELLCAKVRDDTGQRRCRFFFGSSLDVWGITHDHGWYMISTVISGYELNFPLFYKVLELMWVVAEMFWECTSSHEDPNRQLFVQRKLHSQCLTGPCPRKTIRLSVPSNIFGDQLETKKSKASKNRNLHVKQTKKNSVWFVYNFYRTSFFKWFVWTRSLATRRLVPNWQRSPSPNSRCGWTDRWMDKDRTDFPCCVPTYTNQYIWYLTYSKAI